MKKNLRLLSASVLTLSLLATPITAMAADTSFGAAGAVADSDYTLEEMLTYAIQDEYLAQAEYAAIMEKYGVQRPFSNIIKAEGTHIELLLPLFEVYGIAVPVNDAADRTVLPATVAESLAAGVDAEVKNIAMYEDFLQEELPADVIAVFEKLEAASENHLAAFERSSSRTGDGTGNIVGNGNGAGKGVSNGIGNGAGQSASGRQGTGVGQGGTGVCLI